MNKILVEITSPAAGKTLDMLVPDTLQLGDMTRLVASVFAQHSGGTYVFNTTAILSDRNTGNVPNPSDTVRECGIRNGSQLLLF